MSCITIGIIKRSTSIGITKGSSAKINGCKVGTTVSLCLAHSCEWQDKVQKYMSRNGYVYITADGMYYGTADT